MVFLPSLSDRGLQILETIREIECPYGRFSDIFVILTTLLSSGGRGTNKTPRLIKTLNNKNQIVFKKKEAA